MGKFEKQVDRNLTGKVLEKNGQVEKAIRLYEENIKEGFEGSHPYNRLAIIFKKLGRIDDEIRVLEQAVKIFDNLAKSGRMDGAPKLLKFKEKLIKAIDRKNKNGS